MGKFDDSIIIAITMSIICMIFSEKWVQIYRENKIAAMAARRRYYAKQAERPAARKKRQVSPAL